MGIDKSSSERLSLLRFPLIVGVVFIHANGTEVGLADGVVGVGDSSFFSHFVRSFISQGIARTAVPTFFLISGYFFFLDYSGSITCYGKKIKKRVNTLLIPFLFWNSLTLLLLAMAQNFQGTQDYFSGNHDPIRAFSGYDYVNAILGINRKPISYQFWFIRDLMLMVIFSPIIYLALKEIPSVILAALYTCWFSGWWPLSMPSIEAIAFFYGGAYFARFNINLFALDRFGFAVIPFWLIVLVIDSLSKGYASNCYIHAAGILLGVGAILNVSKILAGHDPIKQTLLRWGNCSFFIFAIHEPLLTTTKKVAYKLFAPTSDLMVLALYFITPILVISASLLLYARIKAVAPKFLSIISGGR